MDYYDLDAEDAEAEKFFKHLLREDGPLPKSVKDFSLQYTSPRFYTGKFTPLAIAHALQRLGIIKSLINQNITWSSKDRKLDGTSLQDPQLQGRGRRRQNQRNNEWRLVSGVPDDLVEHNLVLRDESSRKTTAGSDGEEEIVWSGRDKSPESSQYLGMETLNIYENQREQKPISLYLKDGEQRVPISAVSCRVSFCGPSLVPLPAPMYMPSAAASYKGPRDGFDYGRDGPDCSSINPLNMENCKVSLDHHHQKSQHQEYRGPQVEKGLNGGFYGPPPQVPHFADGLGAYYPGMDGSSEAVGPPCYDYLGHHKGQPAPDCDLLDAHSETGWHPAQSGHPARSSFQGGPKQQGQSNGGHFMSRRGSVAQRGGRGRNPNRNGRSGRGGSVGKTGVHRDNAAHNLKENLKGEGSEVRDPVLGGRRVRSWKASQEADGDIFISQPFSPNHDRPQTISVSTTEGASISVVNNGPEQVKLTAVKMLLSSPKGSFSLSLAPPSRAPSSTERIIPVTDTSRSVLRSQNGVLPGGPWLIGSGLHLRFKLGCTASLMGLHKAVILFDFGIQKIVRYITLICEDEIAKSLAPTEPYACLPRPRVRSFYKFVPGVPPPLPVFKKRLEFYPIPPDVRAAMLQKETLPVFLEGLRKDNYCEYFSALKFAEELQMEVDIRAYDMQNMTMWRVGFALLGLKVPGLAERRPSVIYRDKIYVRPSGSTAREFQGYVHKVQADEVHLRFSDMFHQSFIPNSRYDIRFSFGRVNIRRAHQGIHGAKALLDSFLFPATPVQSRTEARKKLIPFNRAVNMEQVSAVSEILNKKGAPPYLIYGPPGTGKTVTVVEAILQVLKMNPDARILACAPSNSASDLLLERLIGAVEKRDMLRLNAYTRSIDEVPPHILPFCYVENDFFVTPDEVTLRKYKVVVTTYWSAAMLDAQDVQPGHFTHIFLDEAGQGTEPEAMVPIANLANTETVIVLAGDHQQLGPIIRSPVALKFGLDKSYLERLSSLTPYLPSSANGKSLGYNNSLVTKLLRNYRSHPAILDLPSRLFYDGELIACADESRNSFCEWDELPHKNFPVLFIGVEGRDEREGSSPSWFNAQEASKVVEIVKKVKEYRHSRVSLKDIGVISPYNQQVNKLKKAFGSQNLSDVKVGTVESFQGQEKRVIIISTVRSSKEYLEFDKKHSLGFLTNPKRFNVAITRAKALLVVVGNPHVLSQDWGWSALLRYCQDNNSYMGCSPPSEEITEEAKELRSQIIDNWFEPKVSGEDKGLLTSLKVAVEDPQWPDGTR